MSTEIVRGKDGNDAEINANIDPCLIIDYQIEVENFINTSGFLPNEIDDIKSARYNIDSDVLELKTDNRNTTLYILSCLNQEYNDEKFYAYDKTIYIPNAFL